MPSTATAGRQPHWPLSVMSQSTHPVVDEDPSALPRDHCPTQSDDQAYPKLDGGLFMGPYPHTAVNHFRGCPSVACCCLPVRPLHVPGDCYHAIRRRSKELSCCFVSLRLCCLVLLFRASRLRIREEQIDISRITQPSPCAILLSQDCLPFQLACSAFGEC